MREHARDQVLRLPIQGRTNPPPPPLGDRIGTRGYSNTVGETRYEGVSQPNTRHHMERGRVTWEMSSPLSDMSTSPVRHAANHAPAVPGAKPNPGNGKRMPAQPKKPGRERERVCVCVCEGREGRGKNLAWPCGSGDSLGRQWRTRVVWPLGVCVHLDAPPRFPVVLGCRYFCVLHPACSSG
ncbi:hypothetical protein LZ30DRAFT_297618 [Colletotrichum cereale]|nr:hypothetical protein LZ30DRAFT_297618 [Colletotrichum cereale]